MGLSEVSMNEFDLFPALHEIPPVLWELKLACDEGLQVQPPGLIKVDADLIAGFVNAFLLPKYDAPTPIATHHKLWWQMCCAPYKFIGIAAPRGHSKSTSISLAYALAATLLGERDYTLLVSDSPATVQSLLSDIRTEFEENEMLQAAFKIDIEKSNEDNLEAWVGEGKTKRFVKIMTRSSEQGVRGLKQRNKRPDLIICDDLEGDEQVMNPARRQKLRQWVMSALVPAGSRNAIVRLVGTILHEDSFLNRVLADNMWTSIRLDAHSDKYDAILWPDQFDEKRLRAIERGYRNQGDLDGYFREYRSRPVSGEDGFFRKRDLTPVTRDELSEKSLSYVVGVDLAVSTATRADFTVFAVLAIDSDGVFYLVDVIRERMDTEMVIETIFNLQSEYNPLCFYFEGGTIFKGIEPFLMTAMDSKGDFISYEAVPSIVDKQVRAMPMRSMVRSHRLKFLTDSSWWNNYSNELLFFPKAAKDDQVDATALVAMKANEIARPMDAETKSWLDYRIAKAQAGEDTQEDGRCIVTGY